MTSQSTSPDVTGPSRESDSESLITLDRATYKAWQHELTTLRQENQHLQQELMDCRHACATAMAQLRADLEARCASQLTVLREKVTELQAILDHSPAVIYVKDSQGRFLLINRQFETLFNLTKEQVQGKSNHDIFPDELADRFWQNDRQVLEQGTALRFEETALQEDGLHTYLSLKFPLLNAEGVPYAVCGISSDISDRKSAEVAQSRLAAIVESSDDAIISKTLDGIIMSWNAGAEQLFGYTAAEIIGQPITLLVPGDRLDEEARILATLKQGQRVKHFETIRQRKDGTLINVSLTISPMRDASGQLIGASKIARDISDRKAIETALVENEAKFRRLVEDANDVLASWTLEGTLTYLSPQFKDLFGYDPAEVVGTSFAPLVHPDDLALCIEMNQRAAITGEKQAGLEFRHKHNAGGWLWVTINISPTKDADGTVIGLQGILRNINARKQTEQALMLYKQAVESSSDAIGFSDPSGHHFYHNRAFSELYECDTPEAFNAMGGIPAVFTDPQVAQDIVQAITAGHPWFGEVEQRSRSGKIIQTLLRAYAIRNEQNDIIGLVGATTDITERKQEEHRAETQYAISRILSEAGQLSDALPKILQTMCDRLGWDVGEFWSIDASTQDLHCVEAWHRPEQKRTKFAAAAQTLTCAPSMNWLGQVWATSEPIWIVNITDEPDFVRAAVAAEEGLHGACAFPIVSDCEVSGVMVFFSQHRQPQADEDWLKVMMTIGRHIGQFIKRRQAEHQLQEQAENLKQALCELRKTQSQLVQTEKMSSLGQLVAGIAHEINNPVNFIHGNVNHAEDYIHDLLELIDCYQQAYPTPTSAIAQKIADIDLNFLCEDLPKLLSSMKGGTERIREIVRSLRLFSRLDEAEVKPVDIHEGIDSTLVILGNRIKPRSDRPGIQIIKDYGNLPEVECYAGQLNQVFMNIFANAIDALESIPENECETTPTISIRTAVIDDQRVQIAIADNGSGMSETVQKRIFDPFFTTKPIGKGTGMGMSISYQIITDKHQGTLRCTSSPGNGTEFLIEIPVRQAPAS